MNAFIFFHLKCFLSLITTIYYSSMTVVVWYFSKLYLLNRIERWRPSQLRKLSVEKLCPSQRHKNFHSLVESEFIFRVTLLTYSGSKCSSHVKLHIHRSTFIFSRKRFSNRVVPNILLNTLINTSDGYCQHCLSFIFFLLLPEFELVMFDCIRRIRDICFQVFQVLQT